MKCKNLGLIKSNNLHDLFDNKTDLNCVLDFIKKIINLQYNLLKNYDETLDDIVKSLNDLLNSIQSYLFYKIKEHLVEYFKIETDHSISILNEVKHANVNAFIYDYIELLMVRTLNDDLFDSEPKTLVFYVEKFFSPQSPFRRSNFNKHRSQSHRKPRTTQPLTFWLWVEW